VASGACGEDKQPVVAYPPGLQPVSGEGFGEVQTPFAVHVGLDIAPGDVVLCRPAKAGEIAERFSRYVPFRYHTESHTIHFVVDDGSFRTYRGHGQCFF